MFRKAFYVWLSFSGSINRATYLLYYIVPMIILAVIAWLIPFLFGTPAPPTYGETPGVVRYEISAEDNIVAVGIFYILFFIFL